MKNLKKNTKDKINNNINTSKSCVYKYVFAACRNKRR